MRRIALMVTEGIQDVVLFVDTAGGRPKGSTYTSKLDIEHKNISIYTLLKSVIVKYKFSLFAIFSVLSLALASSTQKYIANLISAARTYTRVEELFTSILSIFVQNIHIVCKYTCPYSYKIFYTDVNPDVQT